MKKNDWIIITVVVVVASAFFRMHFLGSERGNGVVEVQVDGKVYGRYSLAKEREIEINDTNRLEIKNGTARIIWADCPDQVCVHHKEISRNGESIICLPNKVVISIVGDEDAALDAVVN